MNTTAHLGCPKCRSTAIALQPREWARCAACSYGGTWGEFQVCECWGYECPPITVHRESHQTVPLSTGAFLGVRVEQGLAGDVMLHERNPYHLAGRSRIYWCGGRLHLAVGDETPLIPMKNPRFETAGTADDAAELAIAFFAECAEVSIQHARAEGIPVEHCYAHYVNL